MSPDRPGEPTQYHSTGLNSSSGRGPGADGTVDFQSTLPDLSFLSPPMEPGELGRLGQYRIIRLLGAGGMGMVFEAEDTHLLRPVALKVMRPELAASFTARTRFLKEARAAAALSSDHIVTVYQVGQENDTPFLAMQLLRGEPLDVRLGREPRLSLTDALTIAVQAAAGLAAAHEKGLIHRDIKPANLWLEADRPGGEFRRVRILDLGLVRSLGGRSQLTTAGVIVGTPHFMAPEQASGLEVDARADLFSLGCVIYTMLTGELAFPGQSTMAVLMSLANHTPPPLTSLNPVVPQALSDYLGRLMAKNPADRPGSAAEVIETLDAMLVAELEKPTPTAAPRVRTSGAVSWPVRREVPPTPKSGLRGTTGGAETVVHGPSEASSPDCRTSDGASSTPPAAFTPTPVGLQTLPSTVEIPFPPAAPPAEPPTDHGGRKLLGVGGGLCALAVGIVALGLILFGRRGEQPTPPPAVRPAESAEPIQVGILHSQTGTMAVSESPVIDATLLAVDEVNQAGGVLGRPIKAVVMDGQSDPEVFVAAADKLLAKEKVAAVFGCWTSASRKAVRPVFERHSGLLFYPVQYEGLEQSPRIVYTGLAPNQQLLPAIDFLVGRLGKKRLYLVGSDYVFPRTAHAIIADRVKQLAGVELVGESFLPLGSKDVAGVVEAVRKANPDAIVNTLNGSTNFYFFKELRAAGMVASRVPTLSVSITENELRGLDRAIMVGDYLAASYFHTVGREEGRAFVRKIQDRHGAERVTSDAMAAAYGGVHLWARAANAAGQATPDLVLAKIRGMSFAGPGGTVRVDAENQHVWQPWRIGKVRADGLVDVVAESAESVHPDPYPYTRTRAQWDQFLNDLYIGWNGRWQAPVSP